MLDFVFEFLFRIFGQVVAELLFPALGYWPGWLILRIATLGRYPPPAPARHNRFLVAMVPYVVALVGAAVYLLSVR